MERCDFYIAKYNKKLHYMLGSPKALSTRFCLTPAFFFEKKLGGGVLFEFF